jgi:hypothetical protein
MGLGFELKASHLQSRCFTALATLTIHFVLDVLKIGSHELFAWHGLKPLSS